ncbi:UNVERIFIED_CONTAM: hypothetical protein Sindi_1275700 [Sesamum indicum]
MELHMGFFAGARGLRQGDPLSPFLFVLVMEVLHIGYMQLIEQDMQFKYHWKCEPARVFQLGFADDLLLFCRADGKPHGFEECVSTTSFSIGLNGKPHGFFAGARGLRQGDPLSPYLFVLVMEALHLGFLQRIEQDIQFTYHWKCESSKVFQMGFADDLLLLCKADLDSIRVFKEGLDWFAELSGLRLNVQKSHLIISRSAQNLKDQMLDILGFQEGHLPMRYLGLPSDCQPLISKIDARINGWEGISLSYAGRVQIIKSVLSALSLYWASAFILPKKVINEIEKRLRTFLWKGTTSSGYAKVAWKDVCRPMDEGGLGFKDISTLNRALMSKKLCDVIQCDRTSIWVQWLYQDRLRERSIWTIREHGGSWGWRKILRLRPFLRAIVDYQIGNGDRFFVWQDPWHHLGPLIERFPQGPRHLRLEESAKLSLVISAGEWQWPTITDLECLEITHNLPLIFGGEDRVVWRCDEGQPTTQALYRLFTHPEPKCLYEIRRRIRFHWPNRDWATDIEWATRKWRGEHIINRAYRTLLAACVYHIWKERNLRRFDHTERTPATLSILIINDVRQRILSVDLASSVSTRALYRLWRIPWPLLSKIDARIAGWEGMSLSYAGRIQIIKSVLSALSIYWASAFILPKAIIKEVEKCLRRCDRTSIWVEWLQRGRLQNNSIWTVDEKGGSWGWRKLLRLCSLIQPMVECRIGDGRTFYLWKDPWHHLGPLIYRFPRGPSLLGLDEFTKLNMVIDEGQWHWPLITDLECRQIIYTLPQIHDGDDRIIWRFPDGRPTAEALYRLICPPRPKVGWTSLLSGWLKIPRYCFILWMAIQEKLPTTDKPWLTHIGGCILCDEEVTETHNHLFLRCRFSRRCLIAIREIIRFAWPNRTWAMDVQWARALLGSFVYHLWRERNSRRFQQIEHPPNVLASLIINDVRQRILSLNLSSSISTCALYRLWRIPWPVEGIPN